MDREVSYDGPTGEERRMKNYRGEEDYRGRGYNVGRAEDH